MWLVELNTAGWQQRQKLQHVRSRLCSREIPAGVDLVGFKQTCSTVLMGASLHSSAVEESVIILLSRDWTHSNSRHTCQYTAEQCQGLSGLHVAHGKPQGRDAVHVAQS